MTTPWWTFYACSLGGYILLPMVLGRTWLRRTLGTIAMIGLWCLVIFTETGQVYMCYYDPYRPVKESCYVTVPQQHIDPPTHWWKNPPLP